MPDREQRLQACPWCGAPEIGFDLDAPGEGGMAKFECGAIVERPREDGNLPLRLASCGRAENPNEGMVNEP